MREPVLLFVVEVPGASSGPEWDPNELAQATGVAVRREAPRGRGAGDLDPAPAAVLLLPPGTSPDPGGVARALESLSRLKAPAALVDFTAAQSEAPTPLDLYLHPDRIGAVLLDAKVMLACGVPIEAPGASPARPR